MPTQDTAVKDRAIGTMCICECFDVFQVPVFALGQPRLDCKAFKQQLRDGDHMATWKPRQSIHVTLVLNDVGQTFVCLDGRVFFPTELFMIRGCVPNNTILLAHFFEERVNGVLQPRVLVYDLLQLAGISFVHEPVARRYETLRKAWKDTKKHFVLQWVGFERCITKHFDDFSKSLTHSVDHVVRLSKDPFTQYRILNVHITPYTPRIMQMPEEQNVMRRMLLEEIPVELRCRP